MRHAASLTFIAFAASCGGSAPSGVTGPTGSAPVTVAPVPIARLSITPGTPTVTRGATLQLTATALDSTGRELAGRTINWSSSDVSKATVTPAGLVTAVASGVATINAGSEGIIASAVVTVTGPPGSVAMVTLSPTDAGLTVGENIQLAARLTDGAGNILSGRPVTWSANVVAGGAVATVSATGFVTAVSAGTVVVSALCEGQSGSATITVKDPVDTSIVINFGSPADNELVGDTVRVVVGVRSVYPLTGVTTTIGAIQTPLVRTPAGAQGKGEVWTASIQITGFVAGAYQVVANATDARGAHGVASRTFLHEPHKGSGDVPPKLK